jgi:hypothetical protein
LAALPTDPPTMGGHWKNKVTEEHDLRHGF